MPPLFVALVAMAAFLLGLRTGIAFGYRAERRRKATLTPGPRLGH